MAMSDVQLALLKHVKERPECKYFELELANMGIKVKLRGLSSAEYLRLVRECTKNGEHNAAMFRVKAIAVALVDPDVSDAEFLGALQVATPEDAVLKIFSDPGDLQELFDHIDDICGMSDERGEFRQVE
jgi:hypothetical protein